MEAVSIILPQVLENPVDLVIALSRTHVAEERRMDSLRWFWMDMCYILNAKAYRESEGREMHAKHPCLFLDVRKEGIGDARCTNGFRCA